MEMITQQRTAMTTTTTTNSSVLVGAGLKKGLSEATC